MASIYTSPYATFTAPTAQMVGPFSQVGSDPNIDPQLFEVQILQPQLFQAEQSYLTGTCTIHPFGPGGTYCENCSFYSAFPAEIQQPVDTPFTGFPPQPQQMTGSFSQGSTDLYFDPQLFTLQPQLFQPTPFQSFHNHIPDHPLPIPSHTTVDREDYSSSARRARAAARATDPEDLALSDTEQPPRRRRAAKVLDPEDLALSDDETEKPRRRGARAAAFAIAAVPLDPDTEQPRVKRGVTKGHVFKRSRKYKLLHARARAAAFTSLPLLFIPTYSNVAPMLEMRKPGTPTPSLYTSPYPTIASISEGCEPEDLVVSDTVPVDMSQGHEQSKKGRKLGSTYSNKFPSEAALRMRVLRAARKSAGDAAPVPAPVLAVSLEARKPAGVVLSNTQITDLLQSRGQKKKRGRPFGSFDRKYKEKLPPKSILAQRVRRAALKSADEKKRARDAALVLVPARAVSPASPLSECEDPYAPVSLNLFKRGPLDATRKRAVVSYDEEDTEGEDEDGDVVMGMW